MHSQNMAGVLLSLWLDCLRALPLFNIYYLKRKKKVKTVNVFFNCLLILLTTINQPNREKYLIFFNQIAVTSWGSVPSFLLLHIYIFKYQPFPTVTINNNCNQWTESEVVLYCNVVHQFRGARNISPQTIMHNFKTHKNTTLWSLMPFFI